ncbi:alpha-amylase family protein [Sphingomonas profundi]|uniref:alpha-amylase family protein n=1 Tax=Alterirhizorhabdus profundi TaxID=2681549 RepID=UPI001E4FF6A4|nr:alpha-amylase family protein [Sphingomonas profundi]
MSNVGGIAAFYPTDLALHWKNPHLAGDFVGEMIEAAHARGLAYIGRFDLSKAMGDAYAAHPDWFMRDRSGAPRTYEGTYQACPNGGWAREYGFEILREGLTRYAMDGVFFNMTGYPIKDYANVPQGACVCENCQRRFRDMYGLSLPAVDGLADPHWPEYLEFQKRTAEELAIESRETIRRIRPLTGVIGIRPDDDMFRYESQRRVHRAAPEWAYQAGEQSRWMRSTRPDQPTASTSAAHIDYPWRQVTETAACHLLRMAQQLATGSSLDLYLMGTIADQDDPRYLPPLSELFRWYGRNAGYYAGLEDASRIGLYISGFNKQWVGLTESAMTAERTFNGAYSVLVDARLPFAFVSDARVRSGQGDLSARFDVIFLPDIAILSEAEAEALDRFVENGGLLIATGQTGAYEEPAVRRASMPMRSSPVAGLGTPVDAHGWSFAGEKATPAFGARIPATGHYWPARPKAGAEIILPAAPVQPFGPPEFSYAEPAAPSPATPGALLRRYGKGASIHLPWLPEWHYYRDGLPDHRLIFETLIAAFAPARPVKLAGRGAVEITVQRQAHTGRLLIHVINYSGQRNTRYEEPADIHGLRLGVRDVSASARALVSGEAIAAKGAPDADGYSWFPLPPLRYFEVLSIETG